MNKQEAIKLSKQYFKSHPSVDHFFITSDGQAFFNDDFAYAHAHGTLKDNIIHDIKRDEPAADNDLVKLSKEQSIEKAQKLLSEAEADFMNKMKAMETVDAKKKGAATVALKKAENKVYALREALALAQESAE